MSEVVCYIERAERGMLPVRVRLLSTRVEEAWTFPEIAPDDRAALQRALHEAAAWIADRVRALGRSHLGALVLDVDGALCSWVSTPSLDADAIGAMLRHAGAPAGEEESSHAIGSPPQLSLASDAQIPGAASVQPLGVRAAEGAPPALVRGRPQAGAQARQRLGVVLAPDATMRLLVDELDGLGLSIGRTVTAWHAIAEAFELSGGASRAERVVAESSATHAHVVADRGSSRMLWVWSRAGVPIAAGAFRLPVSGAGEQARPVIERADLARLASEWIAWSTQLGASPARVRALLPSEAWAGGDSLGEAVAAVWPGATADIVFDDDPLASVLVRFADSLGGVGDADRPALVSLQTRPGRQHRAMYRWGASAITLAAGVMAVASYVVHKAAEKARGEAEEQRASWRTVAGNILPAVNEGASASPNLDDEAVAALQTELERRRKEIAPVQATPEKPVLKELETLSFVLSNPDYTLESLDISSTSVMLVVTVPDTAAYEELVESLSRIAGSSVGRWDASPDNRANGVRAVFTGLWSASTRAPERGGGA